MNSLSNDDIFSILQFLPGGKIVKCIRLNKRIASIVTGNPKRLPKPAINISVLRLPDDDGTVTEISISKSNGNVITSLRGLMFSNQYVLSQCKTLRSFYELVTRMYNFTIQIDEFMNFLFSKTQIEDLQLFAFDEVLWNWFKQAITNTNCFCKMVSLMNEKRRLPVSDPGFISDLLHLQFQQKNHLQLRIVPENTQEFFTFPEHYSGLEFVAGFSSNFFIYAINTLMVKWVSKAITTETKIRVRLQNFSYCSFAPTRSLKNFLQNIKNLQLSVLNIPEEKLDRFVESSTWFELFNHLDFQRYNRGEIFRVKFVKEGNCLLLTTQIL